MTTTSILILFGIVSAFLLFGGALAWGDFYSRRRPGEQVLERGNVTFTTTIVPNANEHRKAA